MNPKYKIVRDIFEEREVKSLDEFPKECEKFVRLCKAIEELGFKVVEVYAYYENNTLKKCRINFLQPDIDKYAKELGEEFREEDYINSIEVDIDGN